MTSATLDRGAAAQKKQAVAVMFGMLLVFYAVCIGAYVYNGIDKGYGTGFSNQRHLAPSLIKSIELERGITIPKDITPTQLADLTKRGADHDSWWNETWRHVATVAVMLAIIGFWYVLLSRLGTL